MCATSKPLEPIDPFAYAEPETPGLTLVLLILSELLIPSILLSAKSQSILSIAARFADLHLLIIRQTICCVFALCQLLLIPYLLVLLG